MENPIFQKAEFDPKNFSNGPFYVIENFPYPQFVTDFEGDLKEFDEYTDAKAEADDCQAGHVIRF